MTDHFRDLHAWCEEGLLFSPTSDECCKLFDASLHQYVGVYNDDKFGGLVNTIKKLFESDPDSPMANVMKYNVLDSSLWYTNKYTFIETEQRFLRLMKKSKSPWERLHIQATISLAKGNTSKALEYWLTILSNYPSDIFTVKLLYDNCIYTGQFELLKDGFGLVMPFWKADMPLYSYLLSLYGFTLEQNNYLTEAEYYGKMAMELNEKDCLSIHTLAHVLDRQGKCEEGQRFMAESEPRWSKYGDIFRSHNAWHWAIFHYRLKNFKEAFSIYDKYVLQSHEDEVTGFNFQDEASFLYRMQLAGYDVNDRWDKILKHAKLLLPVHSNVFTDAHVFLCLASLNESYLSSQFNLSLSQFIQSDNHLSFDRCNVVKSLLHPLTKAISAFHKGNFHDVVSILKPIRYQFVELGGSVSQRDVFNLLLIHSAVLSDNLDDKLFGKMLLHQRQFSSPDRITEELLTKYYS